MVTCNCAIIKSITQGIIDIDTWVAFRNIRNNLERDYPDELDDALMDLKDCVDSFTYMKEVVNKVQAFAGKYNASS